MTKSGTYNITSIVCNLYVAETVSKAGNFGGDSGDRAKGEIRRQSVEVRLLCLIEEVARVQNRVVGLLGTCSVRRNYWRKE